MPGPVPQVEFAFREAVMSPPFDASADPVLTRIATSDQDSWAEKCIYFVISNWYSWGELNHRPPDPQSEVLLGPPGDHSRKGSQPYCARLLPAMLPPIRIRGFNRFQLIEI
jgi:hypothetical protein